MKPLARHLLSATLLAASFGAAAQETIPAPDKVPLSFAWGSELGIGIDIGGHDMSDVGINAYFGMKNRVFQLMGAGAGIEMMMGNNSRYFPVYGIIRTDFGVANAPCFLDARLGVAFNDIADDHRSTDPYVGVGIGFNLATSAKYRSYIILSYIYNDLHYCGANPDYGPINGINYANLAIGITF